MSRDPVGWAHVTAAPVTLPGCLPHLDVSTKVFTSRASLTPPQFPRCVGTMSSKPSTRGWIWGNLGQLALVSGASALLAVIVFIVHLTNIAQGVSEQKGHLSFILSADVSTTITLVRALQGLLTTVITVLVSQSFSYIQWGFAHDSGARYLRQLAVSPTTSVWGTIRLIAYQSSTFWPRFWALCR